MERLGDFGFNNSAASLRINWFAGLKFSLFCRFKTIRGESESWVRLQERWLWNAKQTGGNTLTWDRTIQRSAVQVGCPFKLFLGIWHGLFQSRVKCLILEIQLKCSLLRYFLSFVYKLIEVGCIKGGEESCEKIKPKEEKPPTTNQKQMKENTTLTDWNVGTCLGWRRENHLHDVFHLQFTSCYCYWNWTRLLIKL